MPWKLIQQIHTKHYLAPTDNHENEPVAITHSWQWLISCNITNHLVSLHKYFHSRTCNP